MSHCTFDFPLGLRLWQSELLTRFQRPEEGYTFSPLENTTDSYRLTVLAGATKVPRIFSNFATTLPEESFLILEFYQETDDSQPQEQATPAVYYSPYLPTREIIATLEPYLPRLIHDGFVGFGLANNRAGMEIFYSEEKVLTCFTGNHIRAMDLLARLDLQHKPGLVYPTDFGHDHLSLLCHPRHTLPEPFASMSDQDLDYDHFCNEITQLLDMYPVEDNLSFFLSKKEQDQIEERLDCHPEFAEYAEDDFGSLLFDWNDFVNECEIGFDGCLWEYQQGLRLRDMIQFIIEGVPSPLQHKIMQIIAESDGKFQQNLTDRRKRLDPPSEIPLQEDRFWYLGVVRNQGVSLRRDLIREGWFQP